MSRTTDPRDPKLDKWLRTHPPRIELALRYSLRARFRNGDSRMTARIDELFVLIKPNEDELAKILRHSHEIGASIAKQLD
jgi:hypothetical protein